jgi:hypothetical protein
MYEFTPDILLPPEFYVCTPGPKPISTLLLHLVVVVEHLHLPLQEVQIHPATTESKLWLVLTPSTKWFSFYAFCSSFTVSCATYFQN